MVRTIFLIAAIAMLLLPAIVLAQSDTAIVQTPAAVAAPDPPAPPTNVVVSDNPNDSGHSLRIQWMLSADDSTGRANVMGYRIYRATSADAPESLWSERGSVARGTNAYVDRGSRDPASTAFIPKSTDLFYRVDAISADAAGRSAVAVGQAHDNWFNTKRIIVMIFVIIFVLLTIAFINAAKSGRALYVRPLAGIDAVDEAIGRATEMGRPILYVLGLGTASDIATIASFSVLGRVAKKVAEYQTPILVPCYDPIVLTVAEETVKTGYSDAGRPDDFKPDSVYFVTQSQFAYVAAVNGTMLRERPATNVYLGKFYAESLLLAETGAVAGSIQIAGTDEIAQLPFFVVACDYTLIGEELYAASVYLNREPILMGTLKAQDWAKGVVILTILIGLAIRAASSKEFMAILFQVES